MFRHVPTRNYIFDILERDNEAIENVFKNDKLTHKLSLSKRILEIRLRPDSMYGEQVDNEKFKRRSIRRTLQTHMQLTKMLQELHVSQNFALKNLIEALKNDDVSEEDLRCPITQNVMLDPVLCQDGHTYERCAIETWLSKNITSPTTGMILKTHNLKPNTQMANIINDLRQKKPELFNSFS